MLSAKEGDGFVNITATIHEGIIQRPLKVEILCFDDNPKPGLSPGTVDHVYMHNKVAAHT